MSSKISDVDYLNLMKDLRNVGRAISIEEKIKIPKGLLMCRKCKSKAKTKVVAVGQYVIGFRCSKCKSGWGYDYK